MGKYWTRFQGLGYSLIDLGWIRGLRDNENKCLEEVHGPQKVGISYKLILFRFWSEFGPLKKSCLG